MSADAIADDLAERITRGEYPKGSQLPTYQSLANTYGVGLTTIAKVMTILRARGTVVGIPGRGTYVPE